MSKYFRRKVSEKISNKFYNNRKGFVSDLQLAILAIAAIIILVIFLSQAYTGLRNKLTIQSCKDSIEAHSMVAGGSGRQLFSDIKCPTNEITIKNLKDSKKIIADDMHRCWYIWGQGKGEYFEDEGTFCHVCSIYQFGDKGKEVDGLMSYLSTTVMPLKYPGDTPGITYADYLMGSQTPRAHEMMGKNIEELSKTDKLDTSQKYATIFVYSSDKDYIETAFGDKSRLKAGGLGLFGVLGGGAAVGTGIFIASNPVGWIVGGVAAVATGGVLIWKAINVDPPEKIQFVAFRPYTPSDLDALQCQKIDVGQVSNG